VFMFPCPCMCVYMCKGVMGDECVVGVGEWVGNWLGKGLPGCVVWMSAGAQSHACIPSVLQLRFLGVC